jgi:hypothetical protein
MMYLLTRPEQPKRQESGRQAQQVEKHQSNSLLHMINLGRGAKKANKAKELEESKSFFVD